jgi:hypothetical protein
LDDVVEGAGETVKVLAIERRDEGPRQRVLHPADHVVRPVLDRLHRLLHAFRGLGLEGTEGAARLEAEAAELLQHVVPVLLAGQEEPDESLEGGHGVAVLEQPRPACRGDKYVTPA